MKVKIIQTKKDYEAALKHVEGLMDAPANSSKTDELELWSLLVEKYEEEHFPIDTPDPVEAIKFRMEQEGMRPSDLQKFIPNKSKVSEVLNYKRPLSLRMIRSLHLGLGIPAEVLVQEPKGIYKSPKPKNKGGK